MARFVKVSSVKNNRPDSFHEHPVFKMPSYCLGQDTALDL
jgi:hypothetical protein